MAFDEDVDTGERETGEMSRSGSGFEGERLSPKGIKSGRSTDISPRDRERFAAGRWFCNRLFRRQDRTKDVSSSREKGSFELRKFPFWVEFRGRSGRKKGKAAPDFERRGYTFKKTNENSIKYPKNELTEGKRCNIIIVAARTERSTCFNRPQ